MHSFGSLWRGPLAAAALLWAAAVTPWCAPAWAEEAAPPGSAPGSVAGHGGVPHGQGSAVMADRILVRVNGDPIMASELGRRMEERIPRASGHGTLSPERLDAHRRELLRELIRRQVVLQEARRRGVKISEAEIDREVGALKRRFPNEDAYRAAVAAQGLDVETIRDGLRDHLMVQKMGQLAVADIHTPSRKTLREYYEQNPDKFRVPRQAEVHYLLFEVDPSAPRAQWDEVRERAAQVRQRVTQGESFASVAESLAGEPGVRAVSLGRVHEGQVEVEEFNKAAFALQEGEVSEPVWSLYGYGLVYVSKTVPERQLAFSELNLDLFSKEWLSARREEALNAFVQGLVEHAKLEFPESGGSGPEAAE